MRQRTDAERLMIDARLARRPSASSLRRRAVILLLTGLLTLLATGPAAAAVAPRPVAADAGLGLAAASTATAMAADIMVWLNRDRAAAGLRPLRAWTSLAALAGQRAASMSAIRTLSHQAAGGDPGAALTSSGIGWYSYGEAIGETSYPWGTTAAANLYSMWTASAVHHAMLFSATYNYIGVGIARASDGSTWSSLLFTESADHTPPVARNGSLVRSGTSLTCRWSGADPVLQTHTAGLRGFNVQYRADSGAWITIRRLTAMTWLGLSNRRHGTSYSFRVQAVDRRGNLSAWTAAKRIWVP
jgi:uncharacterized protein YkwD